MWSDEEKDGPIYIEARAQDPEPAPAVTFVSRVMAAAITVAWVAFWVWVFAKAMGR